MTRISLATCLSGCLLCGTVALSSAQDVSRYRGFELGSSVAAVAGMAGVPLSEVRVVLQRPAIVQELTWRPNYGSRRPVGTDMEAVEQIVFSFHEDRLFRMIIDYARDRTAGLVDEDLIGALSAMYGLPLEGSGPSTPHGPAAGDPEERGSPVARWGAGENSVVLYRWTSYTTTFRLIVTAEPVAALARTAAARAAVLDTLEAPQRQAAREKQEGDNRRAAEEKARSANKATFRP